MTKEMLYKFKSVDGNQQVCRRGDLLEICRGLNSHWALYIGSYISNIIIVMSVKYNVLDYTVYTVLFLKKNQHNEELRKWISTGNLIINAFEVHISK